MGAFGTVVVMRGMCGRPGCSAPASVSLQFDGRRRAVWLDLLVDEEPGGRLCRRHADALAVPRGWQLHDRRSRPTATALSLPFSEAPKPPPATDRSSPPQPSTRPDWAPRRCDDDDLDGLLDAKTPLLARAFRNARAN